MLLSECTKKLLPISTAPRDGEAAEHCLWVPGNILAQAVLLRWGDTLYHLPPLVSACVLLEHPDMC